MTPAQTPTAKPRSWNYNHALAICAQSRYKSQAAEFVDAITNNYDISNLYYTQVGHLPSNRNFLGDPMYDTEFFRAYKQQLTYATCMNANNPSFSKTMVFCTKRGILRWNYAKKNII